MKMFFHITIFIGLMSYGFGEEVRLLDLDPQDAQQIIDQQDPSLKYAPKIESNAPAVRYLGNEPHNVLEDIYLANQYHGQDGLGGYLYGYSVPDIAKTERKKPGGDLRGAYNYIAGNGQEIKVEYWDDGTGFHQVDNVPKNLPEDLPEVKKAKEEFMRIWQEQAERNSHPVQDPYNSEGQYKEGPLSPQGQIYRQQQLASQFGNPEPSASQQRPIYQSNLENSPQSYSSIYQPYQGRDQQNREPYQAKQLTQNQGQSNQKPQQSSSYQPSHSQWNQQSAQPSSLSQWNQQPQNPSGYQALNQKPQGIQSSYQSSQSQYQGQASQNVNKYSPQPQPPVSREGSYQTGSASHQANEDDGEYKKEENEGPPKGFFYKFDYPVGIITSKQGPAQAKQVLPN